jgi:death-on-curing protein
MASALTFLEVNGTDIANYDGAVLYDAMIGIAEKRLDRAALAAMFRAHLAP